MAIWCPGMEREQAPQYAKTHKDEEEPQPLKFRTKACLLQRQEIKSVQSTGKVHGQYPNQSNHGSHKQIKGQLHGAIFAGLWRTPHEDHQILGENGQFKEKEQLKQIQRGKHTKDTARQEHEEGKKLTNPIRNLPGDHHAAKNHKASHQLQGDTQSIHTSMIGDAPGW